VWSVGGCYCTVGRQFDQLGAVIVPLGGCVLLGAVIVLMGGSVICWELLLY